MDWTKAFEGNSDDEFDPESLYSIFGDCEQFCPDICPRVSPAPLQQPPAAYIPSSLNELPNHQTQWNVTPQKKQLFLPALRSHNSNCPLVIKLEPLRCLFVQNWVQQCEMRASLPSACDVIELVISQIDPEKICNKKPEELNAIMRTILSKEDQNKVIDKRRKLLRKRHKQKLASPVHKRPRHLLN